ncbi:type I-E CRISPR-associated endoribonuclease Cas2e [Roseibacillus persicicus]|uniref:type I-E CRISPR-associated endoribonuclease Cas2e n=1 Tax=Roseibacillus persicicus TaxID=454148 RepID=UPI002810113F|nr:type I-E CRISPR-associated endoribonuclease Cas2e [Roseibacillus persicicus]MDQ8189668.1 type I-E CRISPR-associated endoribonuclease Cas2e [Roseibacillus persicicus]
MTVLITNDTPPAIRGHLKRWFIEAKPNVFVGTMNVRTFRKILDFIKRHAGPEFGLMAITSAPNCQGYQIERFGALGKSGKQEVTISGIPLIAEQWIDPENVPF